MAIKLFLIALLASASVAFASDLPQRPDPKLTPGVIDPKATLAVICVKGYTSQPGVRNVTGSTKAKVFAKYGVDPKADHFEIDHLISLELGGSNDILNLWPQAYTTKPLNAHTKDVLENKLHRLICAGKADLKAVQHDIATDWTVAYTKYVGALPK